MSGACTAGEVAYIGDDVNDLPVLQIVAGSGPDRRPRRTPSRPCREVAHFVSTRPGGQGAFREFTEAILDLRAAATVCAFSMTRRTP